MKKEPLTKEQVVSLLAKKLNCSSYDLTFLFNRDAPIDMHVKATQIPDRRF